MILAMIIVTLFVMTQITFAGRGVEDNPCQFVPPGTQLSLDYGGHCYYEAENSRLPSNHSGRRVLYFGDSITQGWRHLPGLPEGETINRGIGAQTTTQMLVRFRADVLNLKPQVVHLLAGTNDIAGNTGPTSLSRIKEAIMSMCEQAKARDIKIVLASILPAKVYPWNPSLDPVPSILALNQWLKEYAAQEGFVFADYYSTLSDGNDSFQKRLANDGIHPNAAGYAAMEPIAREAIAKAFQK